MLVVWELSDWRMHIPVMNQAGMMGDFGTGEYVGRDFDDESEAEVNVQGVGEGSVEGEGGGLSSRGGGGAIRDRPVKVIPCPRCQSMNTKFCYYNNYSVNQPRHFCRNCQRYWTVGGTLRNVPVGGGSRKKSRTRPRNDAYLVRTLETTSSSSPLPAVPSDGLLSANSCMQQLSMLPTTLSGMGFSPFSPSVSQLPFLPNFGATGLFPQMAPPKSSSPISGLQEVPELRSFYEVPQVPQLQPVNSTAPPMIPPPRSGFFLPDFQSEDASLASVMAKAGFWSSPAPQLQSLTGGQALSAPPWEDRPLGGKANSLPAQLQQQFSHWNQYEPAESKRSDPIGSTPTNSKLAPLQAGFWETALLQSRPVMHDRLVPLNLDN